MERVYFILKLPGPQLSLRLRSQDRNSGRNLEAETIEGCYLLTYFPWLAQLTFFIQLRTVCSGGTAHGRLGPSMSRKYHTDKATGQCNGGHFSFEDPSSQMTIVGIKLTKNNQRKSGGIHTSLESE